MIDLARCPGRFRSRSQMPATNGTGPARTSGLASFGCENCREQHLRCDRVTPTCGRCSAARRKCRRTGLKIRLDKKSFKKTQKWVKTPRRLDFVDETRAVTNDATQQDSEAEDGDGDLSLESPCGSEDSGCGVPAMSTDVAPSSSMSSGTKISPTDRFIQRTPEEPVCAVPYPSVTGRLKHVSMGQPLLPLPEERDAKLFRHFVQKLACWLDLTDIAKSFETIVPRRASESTVLMKAILTLASRHLANTTREIDHVAADQYHLDCMRCLHPILKERDPNGQRKAKVDGVVFAATIIMRVWEEINAGNEDGQDYEGYLLSIHQFVEISDITPGSLSAASFWVGLRQEIYVAVTKQEMVRMPLGSSLVDSLTEADDYSWANFAVLNCARVLNFFYNTSGDRPDSRWEELDGQIKHWDQYRPVSFTEIYHQDSKDCAFPEIWYHQGCHVIGMQHHLLAKLYLARCDPKHRELTPPKANSLRSKLQALVRKICGIGLGNQWTPPSMFTACMAIAAFGLWFDDPRDRDAMIAILKKTEDDHARPTTTVRRMMVENHWRMK